MNLQLVEPHHELPFHCVSAFSGGIICCQKGGSPIYADLDDKPFTYYTQKNINEMRKLQEKTDE